MPPPASVKIGPIPYTVQYAHDAVVDYGKKAGTDVYGACQNRICNIIIDTGYPIQKERAVMLHEVTNAIQCVYDLDALNLKDSEEHYTSVFSHAWLSVMQDNPDLVAYLTGKE